MHSSPLANYLRSHRRRAGLTQEEIAFLLGTTSVAEISRYEHARQTPQLRTLLAYEYLFQTPIRNIFDGVSFGVEKQIRKRVRQLIEKLQPLSENKAVAAKIEILKACLLQKRSESGAG